MTKQQMCDVIQSRHSPCQLWLCVFIWTEVPVSLELQQGVWRHQYLLRLNFWVQQLQFLIDLKIEVWQSIFALCLANEWQNEFQSTWICISSWSSRALSSRCPARGTLAFITTLNPVRPLLLPNTLMAKLCSALSFTDACRRDHTNTA